MRDAPADSFDVSHLLRPAPPFERAAPRPATGRSEAADARVPSIEVLGQPASGGAARGQEGRNRKIRAAGDLIENRPPLSRWHPDYADAFAAFLKE